MSPQNANLAQKGIVSPADLVKLARMPPAPLRKEGDCSCDLSKAEPRRGFRGAHRYAASAAVRGAPTSPRLPLPASPRPPLPASVDSR